MKDDLKTEFVNGAECDKSPIHLLAGVQGSGCLLAFTVPDQRIQMISQNTLAILGLEENEVLGSKLDHIFDTDFLKLVSAQAASYPWPVRAKHLEIRAQVQGKSFDAYFYQVDGLFVMELEEFVPSYNSQNLEIENQQILRDYAIQSKTATNLAQLSQLVCTTIRKVTGLDRVMMYRFMPPTWHGEVLAEDRVASAHSYMGHRFPATDIPLPARELYLRNQVRLIPDIEIPVAPLKPRLNPKTSKPLDLSDSRLRAVAPVHLEYLKNMGVQASFSVAVTYDEKLWGLITCHHLKPLFISQDKRTTCEVIANIFAVQAHLLEKSLDQNERLEFEFKLRKILESLRLSADPLDHFFKQHRNVTEAFRATGIALVNSSQDRSSGGSTSNPLSNPLTDSLIDSLSDFAGMTPIKSDIEALASWLRQRMQADKKSILALHQLAVLDPRWSAIKDYASGVLAIEIPEFNHSLLLIFRPEVIQTITWGGDPRKQLEKRKFAGTLHPRNSFAAWEETLSHESLPWAKYEVDGAAFLRDFVFDGLVRKERLIRELSQKK